ncbi:hypothetical protein R1flu_003959 [Riccia fluitans]|uniref:Ubiquitin-specific protease family C19-related protein n=1 Tax=Riccia fluitans TaxID=41844 RepID=A0ABD1YNZ2_9MARC
MGAPHGNVPGITATRFPSHQLSNGLYVSGLPDQQRDKGPTMGVPQMPYTGGDVKKSGELGKMFDIPVERIVPAKLKRSGTFTAPAKTSSYGASSSHSGPLLSNGNSPLTFGPPSSASAGPAKQPLKPVSNQVSKSGPLTGGAFTSSRQSPNSGPLTKSLDADSANTGHMKKLQSKSVKSGGSVSSTAKLSGSISPTLPATGLITSGPLGSVSTLGAARKSPSGPLDGSAAPSKSFSGLGGNPSAINPLSHDLDYSFRKNFPKVVLWTVIPLFIMGFIAGGFIIAAVHNSVLLIVVGALFLLVVLILSWNTCWGSRTVTGFLEKFRDSELGAAKDGQYVKITGVVTCGSVPLESSYQNVTRCMYTSTGLYEYRSFFSKPAAENHKRFTWGLRYMERHIVDFYISDLQTGLRALVKAGYGARVTPYVDESIVMDLSPHMKDPPPDFLRWLEDRKLSTSGRAMRLKEGYIKEGSTVTVLGVVQRHENVLMIVPPSEAVSTGCQWRKFLLPATLEGIIVACDKSGRNDGVPL